MEASPETMNPNRSTATTERNTKTKEKKNYFEFCKVCKLNHNHGRRHNYFPNHIKSLSSFLSRFQSKLSDVRFFLKNPSLLRPELASRNRFWCVFCDFDVTELDSSFACEKGISHLASADHLKNVKSFMWKYGGGMDQVDRFLVSEADLAKYEKKCISMKSEGGSEHSRGLLVGPSNDIHKFEHVDNFDISHISSRNSSFSNDVLPLQNHTNENYQVSHSELSRGEAIGTSSYDNKSFHLGSNAQSSIDLTGTGGRSCSTEGYLQNGLGKTRQVYADKREAQGEGGSAGFTKLTQISSTAHEAVSGNVHSGALPPWFDTTNRIHLDPVIKKTVKSKLNPKRVGAAWAERRKIEMEMEKKGVLAPSRFDANWLPNFGSVWQSGSRKESRKEFEVEAKKPLRHENPSVSSLQLQPYISKRMRREANE